MPFIPSQMYPESDTLAFSSPWHLPKCGAYPIKCTHNVVYILVLLRLNIKWGFSSLLHQENFGECLELSWVTYFKKWYIFRSLLCKCKYDQKSKRNCPKWLMKWSQLMTNINDSGADPKGPRPPWPQVFRLQKWAFLGPV